MTVEYSLSVLRTKHEEMQENIKNLNIWFEREIDSLKRQSADLELAIDLLEKHKTS